MKKKKNYINKEHLRELEKTSALVLKNSTIHLQKRIKRDTTLVRVSVDTLVLLRQYAHETSKTMSHCIDKILASYFNNINIRR